MGGETVDVKVDSFTNEAGTIDITGSGLESISCLGKSFSKSGQDLSVDLSDCVDDVQINFLQYCSDQDENHATVLKSLVLLVLRSLLSHDALTRHALPSIVSCPK